jgi:hypothetical protein
MKQAGIQMTLEIARECILLNDTSCSYKVSHFIAFLAMKQIQTLEQSLEQISVTLCELKQLRKQIETNCSESDNADSDESHRCVSKYIYLIIMEQSK